MTSFLLQEGQKNIEPLLQQAFKWVVDTSGRQIAYMREYEDSVGELKDKKLTTSWVQAEVDTAINNGEDVDIREVEKLKGKEKQIMAKAEIVVREFDRVDGMKAFTCCGCVPNVWRRYCIGRKARIYIQQIEKFRNDNHSKIISVDIPPGEVTANSCLNSVKPMACELQSRAAVMNKIIRVLEDDSIQEVGVWGPEGAGKSMLMNQVWYRVNQWEHFQRARVEVPQMQDASNIEEEIQRQIFKEFCPKLLEKIVGFTERAEHLRKRLNSDREKKAVIILDGLLQKIDLDNIGIPRKGKKVCNIIVTARDMDLLVNDMGLSRERILAVKPLKQKESEILFLRVVKRSGQNIDEEKEMVAGEIVKNCGGLPSLIEHQASILTNQRNISAWYDALRDVRSQNSKKMLKQVEETLSFSSSNENDPKEIKWLFSLCGLFGESPILIEDLIIHCRALGIFTQDMTVKETKDRVKRLLHILRARFLVDGYNKVEITDLLREVAVLIASKEKFLVVRNGGSDTRSGVEKEQLDVCTALSIDGLDILMGRPELKYPKLKMLQLGSRKHFPKIRDDIFFNRMKELRGLHLKQIDFVSPSFPSTDKDLENLQSLCLDGCRLNNVGNICNLKKLQILKILGSHIVELPKDLTNLTDLRLLNLRGCQKLQVIEHGVLGGLKRLEELYLDDSFHKWGVPHYQSGSSRRNASLDELNELTCLSSLSVYVPNSAMFPENLKLDKLERYKILLGDVEEHSRKSVNKRALRLDLSDSSSILSDQGIKRILHKTKSLYLKGAMQMPKPSVHQLSSHGFPFLQDLHLENCDSVEYIVESSESVLAFPNLKTLTIVNLKKLEEICNGKLMDESFGQLNTIIVEKCDALKNIFDISAMERIFALKTIEVKYCNSIKAIVNDDNQQNEGTRKKIEWDKLHHLSLQNLPAIEAFCVKITTQTSSESETSEPTAFFDGKLISFPGLRSLTLLGLGNVRKIWHQNIPPPELSNLQSLKVQGFKEGAQLEDILFYSPKSTPKESFLQKLASGFSCLKDQVDHDQRIHAPQGFMTFEMKKKRNEKHPLETKTLYSDGHLKENLGQNLRCLKVCDCETLEFLLTTSMVQALPRLSKLTIEKCKIMKEVIQVESNDNGSKSIELQELTTLSLKSLENLTAFSEGNISISFPSLKRLKISDCLKLTALFTDSKHGGGTEEISGSLFHAKVSPPFPSLADLEIRNMNKLKRIWQCQSYKQAKSSQHGGESDGSSSKNPTSELWRTFQNIKKLRIIDCGSLVKIFDVEDPLDAGTIDNDNYLDAQLNEVYLKDLTDIKHIWGRKDPTGSRIRYRYLQKVALRKCQKIKFVFPSSMTKDLLQLQSIKVKLCDKIKHLIGKEISQSGEEPPFFFPDVKTLKLWKLEKLVAIHCRPRCSEWPSLEQLTVSECNNFKIFASNQASQDCQPLFLVNKNSFCRLSTLEVRQNRLMKEIWPDSSPKELFRNLKDLKLISSGEEPVILPDNFLDKSPHLECLHVHHVPIKTPKTKESKRSLVQAVEKLVTERSLRKMELSMIPGITDLKEALDSLLGASSYSFGLLTSLQVSDCRCLPYLFTYSTLQSLVCLTRLTIANCESMKVVVARERGKSEGKVILGRLECLKLESLQRLTSFCEGNYKLEFPSLEEVTVRECSKMMRFTDGETISRNITKVEFEGSNIDLDDERNLNEIIKALCKPSLIRRLLRRGG